MAGAAATALAVLLAVLWPRGEPSPIVAAGQVDDFALGSVTHFEKWHFFLVRLEDGSFLALYDRASGHLDDPIEWRPDFEFNGVRGWFRSPMHAETYDIVGELAFGPASRSMDRFPVAVVNGEVQVNKDVRLCAPGPTLPGDGCVIPRYFEAGYRDRESDEAHYDLYDFLTNAGMYSLRGGFHLLAQLVGLPGKRAVDGADVQSLWESGRLAEIHAYCRRDVIQTYVLFLRLEVMRGRITAAQHAAALDATAAFRAEL